MEVISYETSVKDFEIRAIFLSKDKMNRVSYSA